MGMGWTHMVCIIKNGIVENANMAYTIANTILSNIYGSNQIKNEYPLKITLINNRFWVIEGSLSKGETGGTAIIVIKKDDGQVQYINHGNRLVLRLEPNTKQGDISYKVSVNGKKVCLSYSLVSDAQLRFLICNTSGMVFKSASLQRQAGNNYRQDFDCSGLPLGEYVLYIHVNGKAFSEKVHIK